MGEMKGGGDRPFEFLFSRSEHASLGFMCIDMECMYKMYLVYSRVRSQKKLVFNTALCPLAFPTLPPPPFPPKKLDKSQTLYQPKKYAARLR